MRRGNTQRRRDLCDGCGELAEIAARSLCYACYRRDQRKRFRLERVVDRHNPAIRREHKKLFRAHANIMAGLSDLGVSKSDIFDVKGILQPYLAPIQEYLNALPDEDRSDDSAGDPQQVPTIQGNQSVEPEQQKRVATVHGEVEARQEADKQIKNVNCEQHNRKFTVHGTSETQINSEQMEDVNSEHHKTEFTFTSGKLIAHTNPKTQRRRVGTIAKVEGQYVWIKPARGRTFKAHVSAVAVVPPERRKRTGK